MSQDGVDPVVRGSPVAFVPYEMPNKSGVKCCHDNQSIALFCSLCVFVCNVLINKKIIICGWGGTNWCGSANW